MPNSRYLESRRQLQVASRAPDASSNFLVSAGNQRSPSRSRSPPSSESEREADRWSIALCSLGPAESGEESSSPSRSSGFLLRRISCRRKAPAAIRKAAAISSGGVSAARSLSIGTSLDALPDPARQAVRKGTSGSATPRCHGRRVGRPASEAALCLAALVISPRL